MSTNRMLIRSTGVISFATSCSRVLGFLRDIIFAYFFGTGSAAQAFLVAFRLPNMLRDLVGEGATDAAIVPILSEYKQKNTEREYWEAANIIFNIAFLALTVISILGVIFAPFIVKIIAPGFLADPEKFELTVHLTRWLFPYVFLVGLVAYSKGVLNSLHHFAAPAFASAILNLAMLFAMVVFRPFWGIYGLAAGVIIGGILQIIMQWMVLHKKGFRLRNSFRIVHPVATRVFKLLVPRLVGTAVYQFGVFVDTFMASFEWIVGTGGIAALYFGHGLIHLPYALFGISLATAVLPRMSREVAANEMDKLKETVVFSLNTVFTLMVPAAVGLMVLASPIVRILFERGEFQAYSSEITANVLFFFAIGICSFSGVKILVNVFYAMGDTKTPVKTAAMALGVNILLNLAFMFPLKVGGLALATSLASFVNFFMLYRILTAKIGEIGTRKIVENGKKILTSACAMILTAVLFNIFLLSKTIPDVKGFAWLVLAITVSGFVYVLAAYAAGVEGVHKLWQELRRILVKK